MSSDKCCKFSNIVQASATLQFPFPAILSQLELNVNCLLNDHIASVQIANWPGVHLEWLVELSICHVFQESARVEMTKRKSPPHSITVIESTTGSKVREVSNSHITFLDLIARSRLIFSIHHDSLSNSSILQEIFVKMSEEKKEWSAFTLALTSFFSLFFNRSWVETVARSIKKPPTTAESVQIENK